MGKNTLQSVKHAIPLNIILAASKAVLAVLSKSVFLAAGAGYNLGVSFAKAFVLRGYERASESSKDTEKKDIYVQYYRRIGIIISVSSIAFALYSLRLIFTPSAHTKYPFFIAVGIAFISFWDIALAVHGSICARKQHNLLVEAIQYTNLATSLISLVYAQIAIMSFAYPGNPSVYNGITGIAMSTIASLNGLYMILRNPEKDGIIWKIFTQNKTGHK